VLIKEAQRLPEVHAAGGEERILSLSDRVWFKVKTGRWRGAAICLPDPQRSEADPTDYLAQWWLGAAGYRRDGDPNDFYASMQAIAKRDAKQAGRQQDSVRSDRWLPTDWDWKRLELEHAVAWEREIRQIVCGLVAKSLRTGHAYQADFYKYSVTAWARARDGETYLVVGTEKIADPRVFAVILKSLPNIDQDAWQPEPGGVAGLTPEPGEVIWSTILPPTVAAHLLETYPESAD
jgi:hypothetical protein